MKKVITAIGNQTLNEKLKQEENMKILSADIQYQEGILEILEQNSNIDFLILSELLPGSFEIKQLIEKIKQITPNIQIILVLENKKEELENYLYAKGIFAILYNNQVEVKDIIEMIQNNSKDSNNELRKEIEELKKMLLEKEYVSKEININRNDINQKYSKLENKKENECKKKETKTICITGTNGVGKSVFTINLAKILKEDNDKILMLDFDILNNSLHTLLGIKQYSEKAKKKIKENDVLSEIQIGDLIIKVDSKIDLVAGINLLFESTYNISEAKIREIMHKLQSKYNIIIIDTSSQCYLEYTKEIIKLCKYNIFMIEANLSEIEKAKRLLNIYINEWKIPQANINILFNKYNKKAIDYSVLKHIFSEFFILGKLMNNEQYNFMINTSSKNNVNKKVQKEYKKIKQSLFREERSNFTC